MEDPTCSARPPSRSQAPAYGCRTCLLVQPQPKIGSDNLPMGAVKAPLCNSGLSVSHLTDGIRMVSSCRPTGIPGLPLIRQGA
jgi:hypothetical protein